MTIPMPLKPAALFGAVALMVIPQLSQAHPRASERQVVTVSDLVNASAMQCNLSDAQSRQSMTFYHTLFNELAIHHGDSTFYIGDSYAVRPVKQVSRVYKQADAETSANMDTDISKFGTRVLRVSAYSTEGDYESFGYYFILKGTPTVNQRILRQQGILLNDANVEATTGGNTRIRCVLAG